VPAQICSNYQCKHNENKILAKLHVLSTVSAEYYKIDTGNQCTQWELLCITTMQKNLINQNVLIKQYQLQNLKALSNLLLKTCLWQT